MNSKKSLTLILVVLVGFVVLGNGCDRKIENIPPQCVGRILTPTGWEDKLYGPGQVDIGDLDVHQSGNSLVLIQTSAFPVTESFLGAQANDDGEDHRVLTADATPSTLDIRLMFTCPDMEEDSESVKRLFTLGNPSLSGSNSRVMNLSLDSIYNDLARLQVRGRIRQVAATYPSFQAMFEDIVGFNQQVIDIVSGVLEERNIPLTLVDCQVSNLKPDPLVWENQVRIQAASAQIEAMALVQTYLDENPGARLIYIAQTLKEIAATGTENGNTVVVVSALGDGGMGIPLEVTPVVVPELVGGESE